VCRSIIFFFCQMSLLRVSASSNSSAEWVRGDCAKHRFPPIRLHKRERFPVHDLSGWAIRDDDGGGRCFDGSFRAVRQMQQLKRFHLHGANRRMFLNSTRTSLIPSPFQKFEEVVRAIVEMRVNAALGGVKRVCGGVQACHGTGVRELRLECLEHGGGKIGVG